DWEGWWGEWLGKGRGVRPGDDGCSTGRAAGDTCREAACFRVQIPFGIDPNRHALFEDGRELPARNCMHDEIRKLGDGRYSIWGHTLYFSTPGNAHPATSGRRYELRPVAQARRAG